MGLVAGHYSWVLYHFLRQIKSIKTLKVFYKIQAVCVDTLCRLEPIRVLVAAVMCFANGCQSDIELHTYFGLCSETESSGVVCCVLEDCREEIWAAWSTENVERD